MVPTQGATAVVLVAILPRRERLDEARDVLEHGVSHQPLSGRCLRLLSFGQGLLGLWKEAEKSRQTRLDLAPIIRASRDERTAFTCEFQSRQATTKTDPRQSRLDELRAIS